MNHAAQGYRTQDRPSGQGIGVRQDIRPNGHGHADHRPRIKTAIHPHNSPHSQPLGRNERFIVPSGGEKSPLRKELQGKGFGPARLETFTADKKELKGFRISANYHAKLCRKRSNLEGFDFRAFQAVSNGEITECYCE